jgi:hypothetical protein
VPLSRSEIDVRSEIFLGVFKFPILLTTVFPRSSSKKLSPLEVYAMVSVP